MQTFLRLLVLPFLVPTLAFSQEPSPTQHTLSDDLQVIQLTDDVWRFVSAQDQGGNWGRIEANGLLVLARGGDGKSVAALIDTPWDDAQTRLLARWAKEELSAKIEVVVPTHSHEDCLGGLAAAHGIGAHSYGHQKTADFARAADHPAPQTTFEESLEVPLGHRRLELRYLGAGHTLDNIVVWIPDEKILFGGCLIKSAQTRTMGYIEEADLDAWPVTLARVAQEFPDATLIVPGHGAPGGAETLRRTLELIETHNDAAQSLDAHPAAQPGDTPMTTTAKGTFEVSLKPQASDEADGITQGRMSLDKTFAGDLMGTGKGEMLTALTATQGSAGYVAIERVTGTLNGRKGSFVLQHTGTLNRGEQHLSISIVPDSGSGELTGISGTLGIDIVDGQHFYTLEYSLPQ